MKIGVVPPDIFSSKNELYSGKLRKFEDLDFAETIYHFFRGSAPPFSYGKIKHIKFSKVVETNYRLKFFLDIFQFSFLLGFKVRQYKPDVIYCHDLFRLPLVFLISKILSVPLVAEVGIDIDFFTKNKILKRITTLTLKKVDRMVFFANHLKKPFSKENFPNAIVIYPTIALEKFTRKKAIKKPIRKIDLLYVGRISRPKGILELLKVFPSLQKKIPNLSLTIVGSSQKGNTPYFREFKETLLRLSSSSIQWKNWVPHQKIPSVYKKATIVILPSKTEGFNAVFCEALASGVPVICSKIPFYKEVLREDEFGYFSDFTSNSLQQVIKKITVNYQKYNLMSKNGRLFIEELAKKNTAKWKSLFRSFSKND